MTTIQEFLSLVRITFDAATPLQPLALLALLTLTLAGFELARRRRGWA